jgi:excisionase family DNA binding protein
MMRDPDFGIVRARAFGTFDFKIVDPKTFLKDVAGTDNHFRLDEFNDAMRSRLVSAFTDAVASSKVPVLDLASRYSELGEALLPVLNPVLTQKYGLELGSFIIENVSVPPEVEAAIDKRSSMGAIGNLNDYIKLQMAEGLGKGEGGGGVGGQMTQFAMGMAMAQQMAGQAGGILGQMTPAAGSVPPPIPVAGVPAAPAAGALPELLSPADAAKLLGVSEADVVAALTDGSLKGKKIGASWRITKTAVHDFLNS